MPRPTSATTVQRPDLGVMAYEYLIAAELRGFIGLEVMPIFEVVEKTADYPVLPIESVLKILSTARAAKAGYQRGDWEFETNTYNCKEHGWEEPIDDVEAALYARLFDAEEIAMEICIDHLLRAQEKRIAAKLMATANAIGNAAVTNEWDDAANATPKVDVKAGIQAMRAASGLTPNAAIMSHKVFENVMNTNEIKNYLQYTSPHLVQGVDAQRDTLARYLGVKKVLVGGAIEDTANKGQDASIADVWDDEYVSLAVVSDGGPKLKEPVFGRTFLWIEDSPQNLVMESYRAEDIRSDIIRCRQHVDEALIFKGANYLLSNITA